MPEVIYVRAICKAATALGLTNQEVADRLGVKPEIFDDAVTREENGGHPSVSSKHPNIYAAATALLEEASQIENGGRMMFLLLLMAEPATAGERDAGDPRKRPRRPTSRLQSPRIDLKELVAAMGFMPPMAPTRR